MAHRSMNVSIKLQEDISILARASKDDSEAMQIIALENKKDGTAMKTIAILGMFFLPGTFLAVRLSHSTGRLGLLTFSRPYLECQSTIGMERVCQ